MPNALPRDVTLEDFVTTLDDPVKFIRGVIGVIHENAKEHGDIVIRFGITGTGRLPNYRIEDAATNTPIKAIDGNGHRPWKPHEEFTAPDNWSTRTMTRTQVEDVLSSLTGFKRRAPGDKA